MPAFDLERYRSPFVAGRAQQIEALLPDGDGEDALELGCGPGHFTRLLRARRWKPTSVDLEPAHLESAAVAAEATLLGDVLEVAGSLPARRFGLVLALEIIEHLALPGGVELLAHAHRVLRDGGWLVLSTPNRWSLEGIMGYYVEEKLRRGERWQAWDPTHLHVYSSREILALARRTGFSVEAVRGYWYAAEIPRLGRVRLPLQASARAPLNRLGFNVAFRARKREPAAS